MTSYVWSIFTVVREAREGLGMESFLESLAYILPNYMSRSLIIILILSFLRTYWALLFLLIILGSNYLFIICGPKILKRALKKLSTYFTIPPSKNRFSSMLASLPIPLLISEDITLKERGVQESEENIQHARRSLSLFSITNMTVFLPVSYIPVYIITSGIVNTDPNVIISPDQLHQIFVYIYLPLAGIAVLTSLLQLFPAVFCYEKVRSVFLVLVIAATVALPAAIGMTMMERSPSSVLIFVQNDDCVQIYPGTTNEEKEFDINFSWSLSSKGLISGGGKVLDLSSQTRKSSKRVLHINLDNETFNWIAKKNNIFIDEATDINNNILERWPLTLFQYLFL